MKKITYYILTSFIISIAVIPAFSQTGAELETEAEQAYQDAYLKETPEEQAKAFDEAAELFKKAAEAYRKEGNEEKAKSMDGWAGAAQSNADQRRKMFLYGTSVPPLWADISLTEERMKPGYPFLIPDDKNFPWVPVIVGVTGVGVVTYLLTKDKDQPSDCSFTALPQISSASCERSNGSIIITIVPADQYQFQWSNGATTNSIQNITAGNYSVTITRTGTDCNQVLPLTVTNINSSFNATITTQDADCGMANGSAIVNVNPAGLYTYAWSTGGTQPAQNNLAPGNHSVTVSLGGTCTNEYSFSIGELLPAFEITVNTTPSSCGEADGTGDIHIIPEGVYDIEWSNGISGSQATGLSTGEYNITVTIPGTTCSKTITANVGELPPDFEITVTTTPADCGQSNGTGNITVNPPGNYNYEWPGGITGSQVTDLAAGEYNITVSISGTNCSKTVMANVDELPPNFDVTVTTTPADCGQANGTGTINVNPPGNYIIEWSGGASGAQVTDLLVGSYNVTVTISGTNCSKTILAEVGELPPDFEITVTTTPSDCGSSNGTGIINVNPPASYLITWSDGTMGAQASGLAPGNYQVTVTEDGTTCSKETSVTITELPPNFIVTSSTTPSGCADSTGTAMITVNPPDTYDITWSTGLVGPQITGLQAGTYSVTVTIVGTSCSNTTSVTIDQTGVEFTATISTDAASCGVADGSASITVIPDADYTFQWSDQQSGPVAQQLLTGEYSVVVTDMNGCSASFTASVGEDPAEYIAIVSTTPGTCIGGGDITFTLSQPVPDGGGPLTLDLVTPEGPIALTLTPGTYQLSSFTSVSSGNYTISVYNDSIGPGCIETVVVSVADNTPDLIVADDFYTTPSGEPLFENALDNDSGLNIQMTSVSDIVGGDVIFNNTGNFTFTPQDGFTGNATFTYVVTDACGTTASGIVTILVEAINCEFNIDVTTSPASCGLNDGIILVDVIESGEYTYLWNTGDTDPTLINVPAGDYTVTIEEVNLGCALVFSIELTENPADHIDNINVTQPTCGLGGEILFDVFTPSMNPLIMSVEHPNGSDIFFIDDGTILLSDYVPIVAGHFIIEVSDAGAGPDCIESFVVDIVQSNNVEITLESVFPPSSPTGMDGSAVIVANIPGTLPYMIFLNGLPYGTANDHAFIIGGLGVGHYFIQITDAAGCESNILEFDVPFPDIIISIASGITNHSYLADPELSQTGLLSQWNSCLITNLQFFIGNRSQDLRMTYLPSANRNNYPNANGGLLAFDYLSQISDFNLKTFNLKLQGGLGIKKFDQDYVQNNSIPIKPIHWIFRGGINQKLGKRLQLQCSGALQGWRKIESPVVEFSISILFPNHSRILQFGN